MSIEGWWSGAVIAPVQLTTSWAAPNGLFPTEVRNDGGAYSLNASTSTLTLPTSNLVNCYLAEASFETQDSSNGRFNPQARIIQTSGTGHFVGAVTSGFSRDNSENLAWVKVFAIICDPSPGAEFQFQIKRDTDAPGTSDGTLRSNFTITEFPVANWGLYTSSDASLYGGTTPNQVIGWSVVDESDTSAIELVSNQVTLKTDNRDYINFGSQFFEGRGGRTQRWHGFRIDGVKEDAAKAYTYYRNGSNDEGGELFSWPVRRATTDIVVDQFCYRGDGVADNQGGADSDGSTPSVGEHVFAVLELNAGAELFRTRNATTQSLATAGTRVVLDVINTVDFADAGSFTKADNNGINIEQDMDLYMGGNVSGAYASVSSGARATCYAEMTIDGVEQSHTFAGDYGRGNQGTIDTYGWGASLLSPLEVVLGQDVGINAGKISGGEAGPVSVQPGWASAWGINLDSMAPSGPAAQDIAGATLSDPDATPGGAVGAGPVGIDGAGTIDADITPGGQVAPAPTNIDGGGLVDGDATPGGQVAPGGVAIDGAGEVDADSAPGGQVAAGEVGVDGSGLVDADSAPGGTISIGVVAVSGIGFLDPDGTPGGAVTVGGVVLQGAGTTDADTTPGGQVSADATNIDGGGLVDADSAPGGQVTPGEVGIDGAGHVDGDVTPGGQVAPGEVDVAGSATSDADITPGGRVSLSINGSVTIDPDAVPGGSIFAGAVEIQGAALVDPDAVPGGAITQGAGAQNILGAGLVDPDQFPGGLISLGAVEIQGSLFVDPDAVPGGSIDQGTPPAQDVQGAAEVDGDVTPGGAIGLVLRGGLYVDADQHAGGVVAPGGVVILGQAFVDPDTVPGGAIELGIAPGSIPLSGRIAAAAIAPADVVKNGRSPIAIAGRSTLCAVAAPRGDIVVDARPATVRRLVN